MATEEPTHSKELGAVARQIAQVLTARRETLAVVETSAGGLISSILTDIAGASQWYVGSVVPYSSRARQRILDLEPGSAVSESAATKLARAGQRILGADWVLSETGIAGPQFGRRSTKPVGLVAVAVAGREERSMKVRVSGRSRQENKLAFAATGLNLLLATLQQGG